MKLKAYFKEKWLIYLFQLLALGFSTAVYRLDQRFHLSDSNAGYILGGWALLALGFFLLDYWIFSNRLAQIKKYGELRASSEELEDFWHPLDAAYGEMLHGLALEYEAYKAEIKTQATETMDFVTRWVHDTKVPLAALRLILENQEGQLSHDLYRQMDQALLSVEEAVQQVLYEMKTSTFQDDFKINRVSTDKLINRALKGYSSFFSYKKLEIVLESDPETVLTDEKWSGYILSQLISNAVKHTPEQGTITLGTRRQGGEVTISVCNTGQGILPQDLGQVFRRGFTASENRQGGKATGYGLYLAHKLSTRLGHRLTAQSRYGKDAQFDLTFSEADTLYHVTKM